LERGSILTFRLVVDGDTVDVPPGALTAEPAEAAEWLADGRMRLIESGSLEIIANFNGRGGRENLQIEPPPLIAFEMLTDEGYDIYLASLDGGDLRRLTDHPAEDRQPSVGGGSVA